VSGTGSSRLREFAEDAQARSGSSRAAQAEALPSPSSPMRGTFAA